MDCGASVEEALVLVEVDGLGYVGGDETVVGIALVDSIDLGEEEDGDTVGLEASGCGHGFRCSPGVAVEDDAGVGGGDVLGGEEAKDLAVGVSAVVVLKDFGVDAGAVLVAEMLGKGDFAVDGGGVLDEASGEAYDDELWG